MGETGNSFIRQLSQTTNADINASVDKTGIDGNWELETAIGKIETGSIFKPTVATAYQYTLDEGGFGFTNSTIDFEEVDFTEDRFDVNDIDEQNLGIFADEGVNFEPVEPEGVEDIDFGDVPEEDFGSLAESGLTFEPIETEEINQIDFNDVPANDLSLLANEDFRFQQLNTEDINQIDFSSVPAEDIGILASEGLDLSELNSEDINQIDFGSVPAQDLSILANSGLNFERLDTEDVSAIDFNSIPPEDIGILTESGLNLNEASNEAVNNVRLGVAADFGYLDEGVFEINSLSADTTFGELSNVVVANANLFDYKGENFNLEDGFSIAETQQLDFNDYKALDFAFDGDEIFDSSYYLEQNPDVANDGINPFSQYFFSGAYEPEFRDPTPYFDSSYYLQNNSDVADDGINPLFHYFNTGASAPEFRDPDPAFDTSFYLEEYPKVAEEGINPLFHYFNTGASEGRYSNETFKTLEESGQAFAVSTDISGEEFELFKENVLAQAPTEGTEVAGIGILLSPPAIKTYIGIGLLTLEALRQANSLQEALEGKIFWTPVDEPLNDGGNIETVDPDNVDFGTEPFDLGESIVLDDKTFIPPEDFLDDILEGRYEFPLDGEGGPSFLAIEEIPDSPIGKTTRLTEGFLEERGVDAEGLKEGNVPGKGTEFDIYKDTKGNLWAVRKGQNPKKSKVWLDNLDNY